MEKIPVWSSSPVHSGSAEVYCEGYTESTLLDLAWAVPSISVKRTNKEEIDTVLEENRANFLGTRRGNPSTVSRVNTWERGLIS